MNYVVQEKDYVQGHVLKIFGTMDITKNVIKDLFVVFVINCSNIVIVINFYFMVVIKFEFMGYVGKQNEKNQCV